MQRTARAGWRRRHAGWLVGIAGLVLALGPPGLEAIDPRSRLGTDGVSSEYWDLVAQLESGHRVVVRFLLTNEGPGDRTAVATGYLIHPDGSTTYFKNGRRSGGWELTEDGRRIAIGSSLLALGGASSQFAVDNDKRAIKIHLRFELGEAPAGPPAELAPGYRVDLLAMSAAVKARVWVGGMSERVETSGRLGITHTWMRSNEAELVRRRIDFFSLDAAPEAQGAGDADAGRGIYLLDLLDPEGGHTRWIACESAGGVYATEDAEVRLVGLIPAGKATGENDEDYPVPATLRVTSAGCGGEIRLGPVLVGDDPLDAIPQPFRFWLSLRSRPYRVWAESPYNVEIKAGEAASSNPVRGSGVTAVTFLNPAPGSIEVGHPPHRGA